MLTIPSGARALDYFPCRYGSARVQFRGPERDLSVPYIVMLGGSPTFGKYVATPFPALVEDALGRTVVNLGGLNAGPDFYLADRAMLDVAVRARVAVLQVTGAEALTNPFYSVHGRRNDRVLAVSDALRTLYPDLDFTEVHFTRHLLSLLREGDAERFQTVIAALQDTWIARMRQLLAHLPLRRVLLWLGDQPPPEVASDIDAPSGPLLVDRRMLAALGPAVTILVEVVPSPMARAMGLTGMEFPETEALNALNCPGPAIHAEVAACLAPALRKLF